MRRFALPIAVAGLVCLGALAYANYHANASNQLALAQVSTPQSCTSSISSELLEDFVGVIRGHGLWCPAACGGAADADNTTANQRRFVVTCRADGREQQYNVGVGRNVAEYYVGKR